MFSKVKQQKKAVHQDSLEYAKSAVAYKAKLADAKQKTKDYIVSPRGLLLAFGLGAAKQLTSPDSRKKARHRLVRRLIFPILPF
ncbi:hypothetical protein [Glaciecola sp. 1036]|uniref:hypothetical protein n=1 Tax=Alteromonadaceae TaxID=72275 RepID=UPI003CFC36C0